MLAKTSVRSNWVNTKSVWKMSDVRHPVTLYSDEHCLALCYCFVVHISYFVMIQTYVCTYA